MMMYRQKRVFSAETVRIIAVKLRLLWLKQPSLRVASSYRENFTVRLKFTKIQEYQYEILKSPYHI